MPRQTPMPYSGGSDEPALLFAFLLVVVNFFGFIFSMLYTKRFEYNSVSRWLAGYASAIVLVVLLWEPLKLRENGPMIGLGFLFLAILGAVIGAIYSSIKSAMR